MDFETVERYALAFYPNAAEKLTSILLEKGNSAAAQIAQKIANMRDIFFGTFFLTYLSMEFTHLDCFVQNDHGLVKWGGFIPYLYFFLLGYTFRSLIDHSYRLKDVITKSQSAPL
jgi:hypothetical protein